jgi:hypothetical protein
MGGLSGPVNTGIQDQVRDEFQAQQDELENAEHGTMPWFLENEYTNAAFKTTAASPTIAVPTGFLRELDEVRCALFYQDTSQDDEWVPITKADYDELKVTFGDVGSGAPQGYCLLGTNYRVFPTPDAEYPLKALIYMRDAPLETDIENNWLKYAAKVLVGKVGVVAASQLVRDEGAVPYFESMYAQGMAALLRANVARQEAGRSRSMGED